MGLFTVDGVSRMFYLVGMKIIRLNLFAHWAKYLLFLPLTIAGLRGMAQWNIDTIGIRKGNNVVSALPPNGSARIILPWYDNCRTP